MDSPSSDAIFRRTRNFRSLRKKPGQSSKFWKPWIGPFKVVARLFKLNYCIRNLRGKVSIVHVNRLKQAYRKGIWKEKGRKVVTESSG